MNPVLGGVALFLLVIVAYAIYGIVWPNRLVAHESDWWPPFLPYWVRDLALYDSEISVRAACFLYLAIAITGLVVVFFQH
jgi:hypothetical protein